MKNKKGFTLVEILVSIGLLALLGSVIAISLNRVFKDNNIKNYNEYVEKIKSSAMLFVNNTVDIINDLNDSSFKIITIGNLTDNGYLKDNIINPNTGETVDKNEKIKVSYDSDHELIVEYPYNDENKEKYLHTLNYTITYGDETKDLCYVGLNTPSLQLIYPDGSKVVGTLVKDKSIKAYLESGEECTDSNLSSLKLGTYKIKYNYTDDFTDIKDNNNVKSAERTITVKSSKPVINLFTIKPQKAETDAGFSVNDAKMDLNVTDIKGVKLKYCIVGVKSDDTTSINNLMMKCSDEVKTVSGVNQLNNTWVDLTNGTISNNKETYVISKNFNIEKEMVDYKDYSEIKFYVFVKNSFEEYSDKLNEYNNGIYLMTSMILFHLQGNDAYFNGIKKETNNIYTIKNIANNTPFNVVMNSNTNYKRAYRPHYYFKGWSTTANGTTVQYTNSTTAKVLGVLNLYAVWIADNEAPTCTLSISGSNIVASVRENNTDNMAYNGWSSSYSGSNTTTTAVVTGQTNYYVMDLSMNKNTCSIDIQNTISYPEEYQEEYENCYDTDPGTYGPTRSYDEARWYCPDCYGQRFRCWANKTQCQCYCGSHRVCDTDTRTAYRTAYKCSDSSYTKYNDTYCYKR